MRVRARWFPAIALACGCSREPAPAVMQDAPAPAPAQGPAPGPTPPSAASLREATRILAADEMDGRRPGTPGGARAVAKIIEWMGALGLQPAGEGGGWTQAVPMRSVTTDRDRVSLVLVADGATPRPLRHASEIVVSTFGPAGTHRVDAELVFVGYGVTAPQYDWDDYAGVDVDGRIAVALVGDPPLADGRFAGDALTYYGRWSYKFEEGLRHGARGVLLVHETAAASYGWNVVETSWTHGRTHVAEPAGDARRAPDVLPIQGWLHRDAAVALAGRCGTTLEAWHAAAIDPSATRGTSCGRLRGEFVTVDARTEDVNVLGKLVGARWPDQAVVVTAHWDHLGHAPDPEPGADAIFNGAIDNASGVAGMLGVATALQVRAHAGRPLGRTVLFLATTGEEEGLLGSTWYADHPTIPLADLAAVVNLDSMNVHGRTRNIAVIGPGQTTIEDVLGEVAAAEGRTVVPDEHPASGGYFRSDHFSFARRGVPAIYLRGGTDMESGGTEEGARLGQANASHYHTVDDEFDAAWSFEGTLQDVLTVASLVGRIADAETPPSWRPTSEFAGVRR
ncbi:MAG: M28 family peptidase [Myxococcales bacterium]|nr:M28 family peptidase [Myxococcales bacterium]